MTESKAERIARLREELAEAESEAEFPDMNEAIREAAARTALHGREGIARRLGLTRDEDEE